MVMEAVAIRVAAEDERARKRAEREQWKKDQMAGPMRKLAQQ